MKTGPDVSMHQGDVDWEAVRRAGHDFAVVKATEGQDYRDPTFGRGRMNAMREAGLVRGVYHYLRPRRGRTGVVEANWAVEVAREAGWGGGDLRLVCDLEETALGAAATLRYLGLFVARVEDLTGERPILYTYPAFWIQRLGDPRENFACPLWIAHYGVARPTVPRAWSSWTMWQYTSSGRVAGVRGRCDLNRAVDALPTVGAPRRQSRAYASRTLRRGSRGPDVRELQVHINRRLHARGVPGIEVDGVWGPSTDRAERRVEWFLGFPLDAVNNGLASPEAQLTIRDPSRRPDDYLNRARARWRIWRARHERPPDRVPEGSIAGTHFTWEEARTRSGYRTLPARLRPNVERHARNLERVREAVNAARGERGLDSTGLAVLSWVRSPRHNREVGGARNSRHLYGDATDHAVQEIDRVLPWRGGRGDFDDIIERVFANGGVGLYPAGNRHVDSRGSRARWRQS